MTLAAAITYLQTQIIAITGIKAAPTYPPENVLALPFSLAYPADGSTEFRSAGFSDDLEAVAVALHFSRANLPKVVEQCIPYKEAFIKKIMADPTLGGAVSLVTSVDHKFGYMTYADQITVGWEFTVNFKSTITI